MAIFCKKTFKHFWSFFSNRHVCLFATDTLHNPKDTHCSIAQFLFIKQKLGLSHFDKFWNKIFELLNLPEVYQKGMGDQRKLFFVFCVFFLRYMGDSYDRVRERSVATASLQVSPVLFFNIHKICFSQKK